MANDTISLRPSWLGKIDWGHPTKPIDNSSANVNIVIENINEDEKKTSIQTYDERYEYIQSIINHPITTSKHTYEYNDSYNDSYNDNNDDNNFIIYSHKSKYRNKRDKYMSDNYNDNIDNLENEYLDDYENEDDLDDDHLDNDISGNTKKKLDDS